jgi:hypothetical protein
MYLSPTVGVRLISIGDGPLRLLCMLPNDFVRAC